MILIIGYGNTLRGDDGVGVYVADKIAELKLSGVEVRTTHQLHIEMLEDMVRYERIILVDACSEGKEVLLEKVESNLSLQLASSHHLGPQFFLEMANSLYQKKLDLYVCMIKGENFELGQRLSEGVLQRSAKAIGLIMALLNSGDLSYA